MMTTKTITAAQQEAKKRTGAFTSMLIAGTIMLTASCSNVQDAVNKLKGGECDPASMKSVQPTQQEVVMKALEKAAEGPMCRPGAVGKDKPRKICAGEACAYVYPREAEAKEEPEQKAAAKKKPIVFKLDKLAIPTIVAEPKTLEELKMQPEDRKALKQNISGLKEDIARLEKDIQARESK